MRAENNRRVHDQLCVSYLGEPCICVRLQQARLQGPVLIPDAGVHARSCWCNACMKETK